LLIGWEGASRGGKGARLSTLLAKDSLRDQGYIACSSYHVWGYGCECKALDGEADNGRKARKSYLSSKTEDEAAAAQRGTNVFQHFERQAGGMGRGVRVDSVLEERVETELFSDQIKGLSLAIVGSFRGEEDRMESR